LLRLIHADIRSSSLSGVSDEHRARFIAGGPRRARREGEGFWAFLRGWIASLFRVDRRLWLTSRERARSSAAGPQSVREADARTRTGDPPPFRHSARTSG